MVKTWEKKVISWEIFEKMSEKICETLVPVGVTVFRRFIY